jgi:hypothetical protein
LELQTFKILINNINGTVYGSLVSSHGTMVFLAHVSGESIRSGLVEIFWSVQRIVFFAAGTMCIAML